MFKTTLKKQRQKSYLNLLYSLLPKGDIWNKNNNKNTNKNSDLFLTFEILSKQLTNVENLKNIIQNEIHPQNSTSTGLLSFWESSLALDLENSEPLSVDERKMKILNKLNPPSCLSKSQLIVFAKKLELTITIKEIKPFQVGISTAGQALTNEEWQHCFMLIIKNDKNNNLFLLEKYLNESLPFYIKYFIEKKYENTSK